MKRCCATGCDRTTRRPFQFWICTRHWRAVPGPTKDALRASERAWRRYDRELRRAIAKQGNAALTITTRRRWVALACNWCCAWLACVREAVIADRMGAV